MHKPIWLVLLRGRGLAERVVGASSLELGGAGKLIAYDQHQSFSGQRGIRGNGTSYHRNLLARARRPALERHRTGGYARDAANYGDPLILTR